MSDDEKPRDKDREDGRADYGFAPTGPFGAGRAVPLAKFVKKSEEEDADLKVTRDDSWRSHKEEED